MTDKCLNLIRALGTSSTSQEIRKSAEDDFTKWRAEFPVQALQGLLQCSKEVCDNFRNNDSTIEDKSQKALALSTLIVLKNSLIKIWSHIETREAITTESSEIQSDENNSETVNVAPCIHPNGPEAALLLRETVDFLLSNFLDVTLNGEIRKRLGHCLEQLIRDDVNVKGETKDILSNNISDQLVKHFNSISSSSNCGSTNNSSENVKIILNFLVEGLESPIFYDRVAMKNEDNMRVFLMDNTTGSECEELRALLFLKIISFTESDKIDLQLTQPVVSTVLQTLLNSQSLQLQKDLLNAIDRSAAKNIFHPLLVESCQAIVQVLKSDDELKSPGLQAILALIEAEYLDELKSKPELLIAILDLLQEMISENMELETCCGSASSSESQNQALKNWSENGDAITDSNDDLEDDVKVCLDVLERLLEKTSQVSEEQVLNENEVVDHDDGNSLLLPEMLKRLVSSVNQSDQMVERVVTSVTQNQMGQTQGQTAVSTVPSEVNARRIGELLQLSRLVDAMKDTDQLEWVQKIAFERTGATETVAESQSNNSTNTNTNTNLKIQSPRERYSAWSLLCHLTTSQRSFVLREDDNTRSKWLSTIANALENETNLRVLNKVLDCLLYYCGEDGSLDVEDLEPMFLGRYLNRLLVILDDVGRLFNNREKTQNNVLQNNNNISAASISNGLNGSQQNDYVPTHSNLTSVNKLYLDMLVNSIACLTSLMSICKQSINGLDHGSTTASESDSNIFSNKETYQKLMPILFTLLQQHSESSDSRELLGSIIECASTLGSCVQESLFLADAENLAKAMTNVMKSAKYADDPVKDYAFQAASNLCSTLKSKFVPFLSDFLPEVFQRIAKASLSTATNSGSIVDCTNGLHQNGTNFTPNSNGLDVSDVSGDTVNFSLSIRVDPETGKHKILLIKTAYVEDLHSSLATLLDFIKILQQDFAPYLQQTVEAISPALTFEFDDSVRSSSYDVYSEIVKLCVKMKDKDACQKLVFGFIGKILDSWEQGNKTKTTDPSSMSAQADGLQNILKAAGSFCELTTEQVQKVGQSCMLELKESLERNNDNSDDNNVQGAGAIMAGGGGGGNQLTGQAAEEQEEDETELQQGLSEVLGALMKYHTKAFSSTSNESDNSLLNDLKTLIFQDTLVKSDSEHFRLGLYLVADFIESLPHESLPYWNTIIIPILKKTISHKQLPTLVHAAAYALSILVRVPEFGSKHHDDDVKSVCEVVGNYIEKVREGEKRRSVGKKKNMATDNCIAVLGCILYYHHGLERSSESSSSSLEIQEEEEASTEYHYNVDYYHPTNPLGEDRQMYFNGFISSLPMREDYEESQKIINLLVNLVLGQHPCIMGGNSTTALVESVRVLTEVYNTQFSNQLVDKKIRMVVSRCGEEQLRRLGGGLKVKLQKKIQRIYADSRKSL